MTPDHFRTFARYNRWANARLYDACAALPAGEYGRDRKAFFRSIHGTLNHVLVADRIWLGRIEGVDAGIRSLDEILYNELPSLHAAREAEDARIMALADALDAGALARSVGYRNARGDAFETPLHWILSHVFNHQTHHRGQVHDMLSGTEVAPPPLDLIYYLRETGVA